jgi:DNA-binding MarR family transcriptional regulator
MSTPAAEPEPQQFGSASAAELESAPEPSAAAQDAARDLLTLFRQLRARLRALPAGELTPSQSAVLLRLYKDGASSTTVLAAAEGVRSQSMTVTLGALDAVGLIERAPDPEDGRRQIITLSRAGRDKAARDRRDRHAWLAAAMDGRYTPAQLRTITEALALLEKVTEQ